MVVAIQEDYVSLAKAIGLTLLLIIIAIFLGIGAVTYFLSHEYYGAILALTYFLVVVITAVAILATIRCCNQTQKAVVKEDNVREISETTALNPLD